MIVSIVRLFPLSPTKQKELVDEISFGPFFTNKLDEGQQVRNNRGGQCKVSLVQVSSCSNIESIRDDPYWTSRKKSLELIELSSINTV